VYTEIYDKVIALREPFFIHNERKMSVITVQWEMPLQDREMSESFLTHFARKGSFSSVYSGMIVQIRALVKHLLRTSLEKRRSRPLIVSIALRCWVNDVTHVSQQDVISLPHAVRENTSLHISQESNTSSLCNSDNSALCSPRGSLILIPLKKSAPSVRVSFNLTP
jgi:hypothetical protein